MDKYNTIQLRNHHLKQGKKNDRTPIYPITRAECVKGLKEYINSKEVAGVINVRDSKTYRLWIGTQKDLDDLNGIYDNDTIYIVGTIPNEEEVTPVPDDPVGPTPPDDPSGDEEDEAIITITNMINCSVPQNTPSTVVVGSSFSVVITPQEGYIISDVTYSMVNGTLTKTENQDGTVTLSTNSVTGDISISATAVSDTSEITALGPITYNYGTSPNTYQFEVTKIPADATSPAIVWSVEATPNGAATIDSSTGLLTVTENCSVIVTATATGVTSVDTGSTPIEFSYALSGPIQFEDWKTKGALLYLIDQLPVNATREEIEANNYITYENAASLQRIVGRDFPDVYKSGNRAIEKFNEAYLFPMAEGLALSGFRNGTYGFYGYTQLRELYVPKDSGTSGLVVSCKRIVKLTFSDEITRCETSSGGGEINECPRIQVIDLRNTNIVSVTGNDRLFMNCYALKTVRFPETLMSIAGTVQISRNNTNMKYIEFNTTKAVTDANETGMTINISLYNGPSAISFIFTSAEPPLISSIDMNNYGNNSAKITKIYVPDSSVEAYKAADVFSSYSSKIVGISTLPSDWDKTMYSVTNNNVTNSNDAATVEYGQSYNAVLTLNNPTDTVAVTMGKTDDSPALDIDITSDVYNPSTHAISIPEVTANIVITATAEGGDE